MLLLFNQLLIITAEIKANKYYERNIAMNKDVSLLISINDDIASIKETTALFLSIFTKLYEIYDLKILGTTLPDEPCESLRVVIGQPDPGSERGEIKMWYGTVPSPSLSMSSAAGSHEMYTLEKDTFSSIKPLTENQPPLMKLLEGMGIKRMLLIPMRTTGELIGYLIIPADSGVDHEFSLKIASLIASAFRNARAFDILRNKEFEKEIQVNLLVDLLSLSNQNLFYAKFTDEINKLIPVEYLAISAETYDKSLSKTISLFRDGSGKFTINEQTRNEALSILSVRAKITEKDGSNTTELYGEELEKLCSRFSHLRLFREKYSLNSLLLLQYGYERVGNLTLILGRKNPTSRNNLEEIIGIIASREPNSYFTTREVELGFQHLPPLAHALANLYAFERVNLLTKKLEQEKNYLMSEINLPLNFQEIVGNSPAIQSTLNKVKQVAPIDATVLVLGETGTGKELIAKAILNLSKRKEKTFITVNCAALPAQLIESELFGHEKGSFTGAIEKRIGKFEVADGGTIFLDEIGELPLEVQAKLLRVLQEKEFERLGGKATIFSDVRIIAATNRDLEKEVAHGRFRADLFFRLNVFPITVPPLRERPDDIPLLVTYFAEKLSKRIGREAKSLRKDDMTLLMKYNWPGNIRELEHLVERAIIISEGPALNFEKLISGNLPEKEADPQSFRTLLDLEREHIINALKIANGKVTGEKSASRLLGINGKTLGSKMRKFGIKREIVYRTGE